MFKETTDLEVHQALYFQCKFTTCGYRLKDLYKTNLDFEFLDEAEHSPNNYGYIILFIEEEFVSLYVDYACTYPSTKRYLEGKEFELIFKYKKRLEAKDILSSEEQRKLARYNKILEVEKFRVLLRCPNS